MTEKCHSVLQVHLTVYIRWTQWPPSKLANFLFSPFALAFRPLKLFNTVEAWINITEIHHLLAFIDRNLSMSSTYIAECCAAIPAS